MLRRYFSPDQYFEKFDDATPTFLLKNGIRALILDIDNTLAPYEEPEPNERVLAWFAALKENGISAAFVSNNNHERVSLFNRKIGIPTYPKGKKPLKKYMRRAIEELGVAPENTAIMGDQIFTDVWAGRNVGIRCIVVPPIKDKTDPFTKFKRLLERPVMRYYRKHHKEETDNNEQ
ncbi:MAG: YqeG family HAD IIIA-type phosphatase [Clostridia bacterium]|nr:YqeG family HAD IIIA-type phosphatase [Clostridia bacterium]